MQKIRIKDFKAIKSADIEIKQTVLLIGEQASGKSTIAKLVYFFKSIKDDYLDLISENLESLNSGDEIQSKFWDVIKRKFYRFFGAIQHLHPFEIEYKYSEDKVFTLKQGIRDDGRKSLDINFIRPFFRKITEDVLQHIKRVQEISAKRDNFTGSTYRSALEQLSSYAEDLFEDKRQPLFIPAGRSITVTYPDFFRFNFIGSLSSDLALIKEEKDDITPRFVEDTYLMLQFLRRVQIVMDKFKGKSFENIVEQMSKESIYHNYAQIALDKIEQILKGKYKFDGVFGEQILFSDKDYVHLSNSSSGQQETIRILQDIFLVLVKGESAFRVIEEPEAHLFPTAQKRLLEIIALMLNATDSQIFLTTHSPYILSVFTNLLFASTIGQTTPIPLQCQLKPSETSVYALKNGESMNIIDKETGLIEQNVLDAVSEELAGEFDFMYTSLQKLIEKRK